MTNWNYFRRLWGPFYSPVHRCLLGLGGAGRDRDPKSWALKNTGTGGHVSAHWLGGFALQDYFERQLEQPILSYRRDPRRFIWDFLFFRFLLSRKSIKKKKSSHPHLQPGLKTVSCHLRMPVARLRSCDSTWASPQRAPFRPGMLQIITPEALRAVPWGSLQQSPIGARTQTQNTSVALQVTTTYKMRDFKSCIGIQVTFK